MLDILILILACVRISSIVKPKGYNSTNWVLRTVGVWLLFELAGIMISYLLRKNFIVMNISGFLCAIIGFLLVQQQALNLPDKNKNDDRWDAFDEPR